MADKKNVREGEYNGNRLMEFSNAEKDGTQRPFSFGKGKAAKMVRAIEEDGLHTVLTLLYDIAGAGSCGHLIKAPRKNGAVVKKPAKTTAAAK